VPQGVQRDQSPPFMSMIQVRGRAVVKPLESLKGTALFEDGIEVSDHKIFGLFPDVRRPNVRRWNPTHPPPRGEAKRV